MCCTITEKVVLLLLIQSVSPFTKSEQSKRAGRREPRLVCLCRRLPFSLREMRWILQAISNWPQMFDGCIRIEGILLHPTPGLMRGEVRRDGSVECGVNGGAAIGNSRSRSTRFLRIRPFGLDKWMTGFWMLVNCKNGVSSMELLRTLGITQMSAWFMLQQLRTALHNRSFGSKPLNLGGPDTEVEADETFAGGLTKNMHNGRKLRLVQQGRIHGGKTARSTLLL